MTITKYRNYKGYLSTKYSNNKLDRMKDTKEPIDVYQINYTTEDGEFPVQLDYNMALDLVKDMIDKFQFTDKELCLDSNG